MYVAGLDPDPIHGREMPYRIGHLGVHYELGLGRRTRCEVELHRIADSRCYVRLKLRRSTIPIFVGVPSGRRPTRNNAGAIFARLIKSGYAIRGTHDVLHAASDNAVGEIAFAKKRGGGQDDSA